MQPTLNTNLPEMLEKVRNANEMMTANAMSFGRIASKAQTRALENTVSQVEQMLATSAKHLKALAEARDAEALMSAQRDAMSEMSESMMTAFNASVELSNQTREEMVAWMESHMKDAEPMLKDAFSAMTDSAAAVVEGAAEADKKPVERAKKAA